MDTKPTDRTEIDRAIQRLETELSDRYRASRGTDLGLVLLALMDVVQATNNLDGRALEHAESALPARHWHMLDKLRAARRAYDEVAVQVVTAALAKLPDDRDFGGAQAVRQ